MHVEYDGRNPDCDLGIGTKSACGPRRAFLVTYPVKLPSGEIRDRREIT